MYSRNWVRRRMVVWARQRWHMTAGEGTGEGDFMWSLVRNMHRSWWQRRGGGSMAEGYEVWVILCGGRGGRGCGREGVVALVRAVWEEWRRVV